MSGYSVADKTFFQGPEAPKKKLAECKGFSIDLDFSELDKVGLKDIEKDTHQLVIA